MKELETAAFSCLEQHFDEAVDFWKSLIEVESPFWNKEAVDRAVDLFAQKAESLGLSVRRIPCASTGDGLIVTMEPLFAYTDGSPSWRTWIPFMRSARSAVRQRA